MDGSKVRTGRSQHFLRPSEYLRTYCDVLLLYGSRDGTTVPEVHLVEEISHWHANGKFDVTMI